MSTKPKKTSQCCCLGVKCRCPEGKVCSSLKHDVNRVREYVKQNNLTEEEEREYRKMLWKTHPIKRKHSKRKSPIKKKSASKKRKSKRKSKKSSKKSASKRTIAYRMMARELMDEPDVFRVLDENGNIIDLAYVRWNDNHRFARRINNRMFTFSTIEQSLSLRLPYNFDRQSIDDRVWKLENDVFVPMRQDEINQ